MDLFGIRKLIKFDTTTTPGEPKLTYASFASDTSSGSETNVEILAAEAISNEAIYRNLGFQDIITKNDIYAEGIRPTQIVKGILDGKNPKTGKNDIKEAVIKLFKDTFIKCLNRGYTQSQAKKIARDEAHKYISEEAEYYIKKWSI